MSASADRKRVAPSRRRIAACGCVVALGVIVSALQFAELRSREVAALEIETGLAFARIEETLEARLRQEIRALERMARRLEVAPPGERTAWEQDAWGLIRAFEHIQAIEWVDTGLIVRWVIPYAGNEAAQDLDLSFEGRRRSALVAARDGRRTVVSRTVDLVQGGRGFLVYVPMYRDDRFAGTVLGVYRTAPIFAAILAGTSARYEVSIMDGATRLHGPSAEHLTSVVRQRGQVSIGNLVLDVEAKPRRSAAARSSAFRSGIRRILAHAGMIDA